MMNDIVALVVIVICGTYLGCAIRQIFVDRSIRRDLDKIMAEIRKASK